MWVVGDLSFSIECSDYDPYCERSSDLASNIEALYYQLYEDAELGAIAASGVLVSIIGTFMVSVNEGGDPQVLGCTDENACNYN